MESQTLLKVIDQVIDEQYQSRCEPDFRFVQKEIVRQPYKRLIDQLREFLQVVEETEPNDDVCFSYLLESDGARWMLQLSMLAKYAVLFRIAENDAIAEIITTESPEKTRDERRVKEVLTRFGISLLCKRILEQPIDLALSNTDAGNTRVYQGLFSDTDALPWQDVKSGSDTHSI